MGRRGHMLVLILSCFTVRYDIFKVNTIFTACLCERLIKQFVGGKGGQSYPDWKANFAINSVRVHIAMKAVLGLNVLDKRYIFTPEM